MLPPAACHPVPSAEFPALLLRRPVLRALAHLVPAGLDFLVLAAHPVSRARLALALVQWVLPAWLALRLASAAQADREVLAHLALQAWLALRLASAARADREALAHLALRAWLVPRPALAARVGREALAHLARRV